MKNTNKAHLAMVTTTIIFGMHYSIAKSMMPDAFTPGQLLFLRLLGGAFLFWLFQRLFVHEKVEKRDLLKFAFCGLFGFALNQALFYEGLNLTNPTDASLIHVLNPVLVLIFASLLIGEGITAGKAAGIITGAAGAVILVLYGHSAGFGSAHVLGNILVLLNMVFYALYLVLIKPLTLKYHITTILKWVSLFGFLFILPFTAGTALAIRPETIPLQAYLGLAYVILLNTFLAYLLINFAVKQLTLAAVSYYTYLQPFIAAVMSVSIGQDTITVPKIIAALLIFGGVYLVNRADRARSFSEKMAER